MKASSSLRFVNLVVAVVCVFLTVHGATAMAVTLRVPDSYSTISAAIEAARDGDTIELAAGVYFQQQVVIGAATADHLVFRGATGNRNDVTLNSAGLNKLFVLESGRSVSFVDLTFANARGPLDDGAGAALTVSAAGRSADAFIQNCRFVNCSLADNSAGCGGAIYFGFSGRLDIRECLFESNRTDNCGGAVFVVDSVCDIRNSQFINNTSGRQGGAVWFGEQTTATVSGSLFSGNLLTQAFSTGGAIWLGPGTAEVVDSSVAQNNADFGPSLCVSHGRLNGFNCDLRQAGYIEGGGSVTMTCCVLGDVEMWNIAPVIDSDGCAVPAASISWGTVKGMFR